MGSQATIHVQAAQIVQEKAVIVNTVGRKADDLQVIVERARASFDLFKSGAIMLMEVWRYFIRFLVSLCNKETAPSKLNTLKKATEKLNSFQDEYKSSWVDLMGIQLNKHHAKQSASNSTTVFGISIIQSQLQLEIDYYDEISNCDDNSV